MDDNSIAKQIVAYKAVEDNVKSHMLVGLGSGTTVIFAARKLGEMMRENVIENIQCVPSSYQARQLILESHLPLTSLDENAKLDMYIDGADECDKDLNLIKGGGGCLVQEKIVAYNSKRFIVIADFRKDSKNLGQNWKRGLPIEVIPVAVNPIKKLLEEDREYPGPAVIRLSQEVMGPARTENGNFIIDWHTTAFNQKKTDWESIYNKLKMVPGIVDVGLFLNMAHKVYFGYPDGKIVVREPPDLKQF